MIGRGLYWTTVAVLTAGCTHLALILGLPYRTTDDAFGHLFALARGLRLQSIALPDSPGAAPFADPAQASAFCLYDLRRGPVAVSLALGDVAFATLAVHARYGRVLYGLTGHPGAQHRLDLVLMTGEQAARQPAPATTPGTPIRVRTEEPEGFVLGQILAEAPSEGPAAKAAVLGLSCRAAEG